jgi:outer membrane protein assembly factor BamB
MTFKSLSELRKNSGFRAHLGLGILVLLAAALLTGCTGRDITRVAGWGSAVIEGDEVYVASLEGDILRLDHENGDVIWRYPDDEEGLGAFYGTPAVDDQRVYVGSYDGKLYALDKETGDQDWQQTTQGPIVGGITLVEGKALVSSSDGSVYCYDTADGSRLWQYEASDKVWSAPTVWEEEGLVFFGSLDHNIYAVSLKDGSLVWSYETGGGIVAKPLVVDGMVVIGAFDRTLYALDARKGSLKWKFAAKNWFWAGAATDGQYIYAACLDKNLYALDTRGTLRWSFEAESDLVATPVLTSKGVMVAAAEKGRLHLISLRDGREDWFYDPDKPVRTPLSSSGSELLVITSKDSVVFLLDVEKGRRLWEVSTKK